LKFSGIKTYDFEYDGFNRLSNAKYADGDKYSTNYSYDKNGNIDQLERWMEIEGAKQQIDDLVYHYHSDGNQLKVVNDDPTLTHHEYGFADNGSFQNNEYNYDENGNMIEDLYKGIDLITYNHLNLPTHIYFANNGTAGRRIGYVYTADGIKLRKYTHLNTNAEGPVSDYVGAFVYENNELQFIQTSEGRLVPNGNGSFNYEYALKDLPIAIGTGNTRVMFDQTGEVLQDQSYYPFGMSMGEALTFDMPSSLPDNKYLYNGKELQDDFDLGWYDYGARMYDPALGRFISIDPISEKFANLAPNNYASNDPIRNIDLHGLQGVDMNQGYNQFMAWKIYGAKGLENYNNYLEVSAAGTITGIFLGSTMGAWGPVLAEGAAESVLLYKVTPEVLRLISVRNPKMVSAFLAYLGTIKPPGETSYPYNLTEEEYIVLLFDLFCRIMSSDKSQKKENVSAESAKDEKPKPEKPKPEKPKPEKPKPEEPKPEEPKPEEPKPKKTDNNKFKLIYE
jgi:RHS repeat-associated protein